MSKLDAYNNKKKKDEEEKVVGQQQKTQSDSHKPTGSTSIPKDTSRTQKSAASSLRTEGVTTQAKPTRVNTSQSRRVNAAPSRPERINTSQSTSRRESVSSLSDRGYPSSSDRNNRGLSLNTIGRRNLMDDVRSLPKANNVPDEIIQQIADKNGMTFEEAKKRISEGEKNQAFRAPGTINEGLTSKAQADYANQRRIANQKQQGTWESFMNNYGKAIADVVNGPVYLAGKLTGNDWDLVGDRAREAVSNAREQHPVASNIGTLAGMATAAYGAGGGAGGRAIGGANNVSAGQVFKDTFNDASAEGAAKAQAILAGLGNAARQLGVNAAKEMPIDAVADIIPTLANDIAEGKSAKQVAANTLLNTGLNFGFNTIGDIASMVKPGLEAVRPNNVIPSLDNVGNDVVEQAVRGEVEEAAEEAAERAAKNNIPTVSEQTAEEAQNILRQAPQEAPQGRITQSVRQTLHRDINKLENVTKQNPDFNSDAYVDLINAVDDRNPEAILRATKQFDDAAKASNLTGHEEFLDDINRYATLNSNISDDAFNSTLDVVRDIDNGLDRIAKLDPSVLPEKQAQKLSEDIANAKAMLKDYENTAFAGESVENIGRDINNTLGRIHTQAAKLEGYDNVFENGFKKYDTVRGRLYGNSDYFPKEPKSNLSLEDQELMLDEMRQADALHDQNRYARPANNITRNEALPEADTNIPEAEVSTNNTTDDLWNQLSGRKPLDESGDINDIGGDNVNIPKKDVPSGDNTAISKGRTNTFERSGINTEESKNIYKPDDYTYVKDTNAAQLERATDNLNRLGDDAVSHYTSTDFKPEKASLEDVDSMMMLTKKIREQAREATDSIEKSKLYAQSRDLSINAVRSSSKFGQNLQGWSKWADTPEHVVDKGYKVMLDRTEDFLEANKRAKWGISDISKDIEKLFNEKDVAKVMESGDKKAIAALKREISDGINDLIKNADKQTKKALKGLSEAEIDQLMYERSAKGINQALEMFAGTGSMGIKDSTLDDIFELMAKNESLNPNSKAFVQNEKKIYSLIANDITHGGSFADKLDTWRYLSMLTNPSTHLRNVTGNVTMEGVAGVKNNLAAVIESAADRAAKGGIDRTKSVLNPFKDGDLLRATREDAIEHAYRQLSGNRYEGIAQGIESEVKSFKNQGAGKAINKISDINSGALSAEDELFKVNEYSTSLAGYLKGNGFDASIFDDTVSAKNAEQLKKIFGKGQRARAITGTVEEMRDQFLQDARAYAINKAQVQTFNNTNSIASGFSQFTKKLRGSDNKAAKTLGYALDVTIPFKKVPANVLETALAYSPAEWGKVVFDTNKLIKGSINAADYIDKISKATTGTVGMLAGAYLAHEGIVQMGAEKGTREKNFDKATDNLNRSFKVAGHNVDITQLMPSAAPIIYGATVYDVLKNKDNGLSALDALTEGVSALADGVTDMTMLNGISDLLTANKYADENESIFGTLAGKVAENAISQMVPTVGGKIAKVFDDTQRNTWYSDKEGIRKKGENIARYNATKIPGAQQLGEKLKDSDIPALNTVGGLIAPEARINSKGEEMKNKGGNALGRLVRGVLPLEIGKDISTETDNKLRELAQSFPAGEDRDNIFPYAAQKEAKFKNSNDEQVVLTPEQWKEYQKSKGQMTSEMIDKFLNSNVYDSMENVDRAETLSKLYDFATKYNQHKIADGKLSKEMQGYVDLYESQGIEALVNQMYGEAFATSTGLDSSTNAAKDIQQLAAEGDMEAAQEKLDIVGQLKENGLAGAEPYRTYNRASERIPDLTVKQFVDTYKSMDTDGNNAIKQQELLDYATKQGIKDQAEMNQLWEAYGNDWKKVPTLNDGVWKTGSSKPSTDTNAETQLVTSKNATLNARLKAKQGIKEKAQQKESSIPEVEGNTQWSVESGGRTYDLHNTKTYERAQAAGISDNDFLNAFHSADTDGNGKIKKAEAKAYLDALDNLSRSEKHTWFDVLVTRQSKNPY